MAVFEFGNQIVLGRAFELEQFPELLAHQQEHYPGAGDIEALGVDLLAGGFGPDQAVDFVNQVCAWGGFAGIGGRVNNNNEPEAIAEQLQIATAQLHNPVWNLQLALESLNQLHGLGRPSFASKHLRFLAPHACPVYDAILREVLPYPFTPQGYAEFGADCLHISGLLANQGVENPVERPGGVWFPCDVEASIFAWANGWNA